MSCSGPDPPARSKEIASTWSAREATVGQLVGLSQETVSRVAGDNQEGAALHG